jgi:hypothetical protein
LRLRHLLFAVVPIVAATWWALDARAEGGAGGWLLVILGMVAGAAGLVAWSRRPPRCCSRPMVLLTEPARSERLWAGRRTEEAIGSVSYEVWSCVACGGVKTRARKKILTRFVRCPKCHFRTAFKRRRILIGAKEIVSACRHCDFRREKFLLTPSQSGDDGVSIVILATMASGHDSGSSCHDS